MEASDDVRYIENHKLGDNLSEISAQAPLHEVPEGDTAAEVINNMAQGLCASCGAQLGKDSMLVIAESGLIMAFCRGVCLTDMQVIGWLEEIHDDIVDRVKFRGNQAQADGPEESEDD